jgi:osmotically inducible lipoprotein OsmB
MRVMKAGLCCAMLMLSACGSTVGERAATGGVGGAVVGGPVGAVVGGTVGAVSAVN